MGRGDRRIMGVRMVGRCGLPFDAVRRTLPCVGRATRAPYLLAGRIAQTLRVAATYDVRPLLSSISAPTLVLHRVGDRMANVDRPGSSPVASPMRRTSS